MRVIRLLFVIISFFAVYIHPEEADSLLDNNTAFYEGKALNYVIQPPDDFRMLIDEAADDGYSFAFIPEKETYDSASMIIGINIFRIKDKAQKKFSLDKLIEIDTTAFRQHYGKEIIISEVTPLKAFTGQLLRTFYLNDTTVFMPNVMLSYFDGGSEILIFDLSVSDAFPRFLAEKIYIKCVLKFKVLVKGKLGMNNE
ncbi:MAG: hypothetical protein ACE5D6_00960 [Candidatus Zixiibacteriota bacterium]